MTKFFLLFFFFNDTATTEIYTLSLHDALPIYAGYKAGHESTALLQKSCRCPCPAQASEQVLQACLPFPLRAGPRESRMQVSLEELLLEYGAPAQFLPCLFSVLSNSFWRRLKQYVPNDMLCHLRNALTCHGVYKNIGFIASDRFCVPFHNCKVCANMRGEVYLIYDQKITCLYSQTPFSRVLVSARNVYYVNKIVCQRRTKGGGDVITATFNYYQIKIVVF